MIRPLGSHRGEQQRSSLLPNVPGLCKALTCQLWPLESLQSQASWAQQGLSHREQPLSEAQCCAKGYAAGSGSTGSLVAHVLTRTESMFTVSVIIQGSPQVNSSLPFLSQCGSPLQQSTAIASANHGTFLLFPGLAPALWAQHFPCIFPLLEGMS